MATHSYLSIHYTSTPVLATNKANPHVAIQEPVGWSTAIQLWAWEREPINQEFQRIHQQRVEVADLSSLAVCEEAT
jgi:hypothetical protein